MKDLILHVGTPKTGTSAIQRFCWENAAALQQQGFVYPDLAGRWLHVHPSRNGQFLCQIAYAGGNRATCEQTALSVQRLNDLVDEHAEGTLVLSDEGLWQAGAVNERGWQHIATTCRNAGFECIQIVVYLRRQDEFIESTWSQHIKGARRARLHLTSILDRPNLLAKCDYDANLQVLERTFGRENITVRIYDRTLLADGDVVTDFLGIIGAEPTEDMAYPQATVNASIANNLTLLKRLANCSPAYQATDNFLQEACQTVSETLQHTGERSMLPPEYRQEILQRYATGNARIAHEYFGNESGELFAVKPGDDGPAWQPNPECMSRDAFLLLIDALSREHQRTRELGQRMQETECRNAELSTRLQSLENRHRGGIRSLVSHIAGR